MKEITIGKNEAGQRVDRFLKKYMPDASTGFLYKMIRKKRIKRNGARITSPNDLLKVGDKIQLYLGKETIEKFKKDSEVFMYPESLDIVYEDDNILLVNKPKDLLVHGDDAEGQNTLINQVYDYLYKKGIFIPQEENTFTPATCNRLDRNTSGIVIVAKNFPALQEVNAMIKEDKITKKYLALVDGKVKNKRELKGYLVKDPKINKVEIISQPKKNAKFIHTKYSPLSYHGEYTLLEIDLITGRSHQIRAHLSSEGFPIIGDYKYGNTGLNKSFSKKYNLSSQFLHAHFIEFKNCPHFLSYLEGKNFTAGLPMDLDNIIKSLSQGVI